MICECTLISEVPVIHQYPRIHRYRMTMPMLCNLCHTFRLKPAERKKKAYIVALKDFSRKKEAWLYVILNSTFMYFTEPLIEYLLLPICDHIRVPKVTEGHSQSCCLEILLVPLQVQESQNCQEDAGKSQL